MASFGVLGTALAGINTATAGHAHPGSLAPAQQRGDGLDLAVGGALSPTLRSNLPSPNLVSPFWA